MTSIPQYQIKPLSAENLEDFLSFFESIHFAEHPHWSACYCYSFHFTGSADQWEAKKNRSAVCELVKSGGMHGYMAYLKDRPVGWCNANDRLNFQRLTRYYDLPEPGRKGIYSIVCFLVHPEHRKSGIAHAILDHIESDCRSLEYSMLEAYPGKGSRSSEGHYMGPLSLYRKHGFITVAEIDDYCVVRKDLD